MRALIRALARLQIIAIYTASALILVLVLLILIEIVLRSFWNVSTLIVGEYSGYIYLAIVFLALGYTFSQDGHIRITLLTSKIENKTQKIIDICVGMLLLGLLVFIFYRVMLMVIDTYQFEVVSETVSETPIYLTQLSVLLGIGFFIFAVLEFLLRKLSQKKGSYNDN